MRRRLPQRKFQALARKKYAWFRIIAVLMVLAFAVVIGKGLYKPRKRVFTGIGKVNIVYKNPMSLVSFDENGQELVIFFLDANTLIKLPNGMGEFRAESVPKLGKQEGKGLKLLADGIMLTSGVGVDGWVESEHGGIFGFEVKKTGEVAKLPVLERLKILTQGKSSLGFADRWKMFWIGSRLGANHVQIASLSNTLTAKKVESADGEVASALDRSRVLAYQSNFFRNSGITEEGISVAVINNTDLPGIASSVGQMLLVNGVRVVSEATGEANDQRCTIVTSPDLVDTYTVEKIKSWLGCKISEAALSARSQIQVQLGKKFGEFMEGR